MTAANRDLLLKIVGLKREAIPLMDLTFNNPPLRYNSRRDMVEFVGDALGSPVGCGVSREVLADHFGADNLDNNGRIEAVRKSRTQIERLLRKKYLSWPVDVSEAVFLNTADVEALKNRSAADS